MRSGSLFVALAAGAMLMAGCGFQPGGQSASAAKGGIAVIDLDHVAKTIGRTQEINDAWQVRKRAADQGLQNLQASFRDQINAKKAEFGEQPTDEQKQILANMGRQADSKLLENGRKAQADLDQFRNQMVAAFRAEVRPFAQQVASSRGLGVVIPKNEGFLLSIDPGVDITNDVISAYQLKKPVASAAVVAPAPAAITPKPATAAAESPNETR
ncbi:MAG: OmpH family outer membrane protein [Planctomycetaceae bacterium]|nr:OmpH family outer membrane protein [Planctomycetaceae bacterium]